MAHEEAPAQARQTRRRFIRNASAGLAFAFTRRLVMPTADSAFGLESQPIYYDSDGLIVHRGLDGGDTAQREGWYWLGVWIRQNVLNEPWPIARERTFSEVLRLLEPAQDGVFYRHPKLSPWNNPHDKAFGFSRDQMVPLVAAMGVWGQLAPLERLWRALPQDPIGGTKHTFNGDWLTAFGQRIAHQGDIVGPMTINLFRRAWNENPWNAPDHNGPGGEDDLRANVAIRLGFAATDRDNTGDDLNLIVMLLMSALRFPTEISQSAISLYRNRPASYGSYLTRYRAEFGSDDSAPAGEIRARIDEGIANGWQPDGNTAYGAVRWYHLHEFGANPQLAELYEPIIRRLLA